MEAEKLQLWELQTSKKRAGKTMNAKGKREEEKKKGGRGKSGGEKRGERD